MAAEKQAAAGCRLLSAWFCPFAQRAAIALAAARVPGVETTQALGFPAAERYAGSYVKSAELLAANPKGLVPVLVDPQPPDGPGPAVVCDSDAVVQYVGERWPASAGFRLMPDGPAARARARAAARVVHTGVVPAFYRALVRQDPGEQAEGLADLERALVQFAELGESSNPNGPYFHDADRLSYADVLLAPFALRFAVLRHYRPAFAPPDSPWLGRWLAAVEGNEDVRSTCKTAALAAGQDWEEGLVDVYERYAQGTARSKVADAVRSGTSVEAV